MFFFAYDGSTHGDWVSHYAARLAKNHADRALHLVHVRDGRLSDAQLAVKLDRIGCECEQLGVTLQLRVEAVAGSVSNTIRSAIEESCGSFVVCGTRVRETRQRLLSGTVADRLLRLGTCNVLALRVVQPGLLGCPRRLLLPVAGHPRGYCSGLPFLNLLGPELRQLHILLVRRVARWKLRLLSTESLEMLRQTGQEYCNRVEQEIAEQLGLGTFIVDASSIVSDDVPQEILNAANRTHSHLVYMGASERSLAEEVLFGRTIEQVLRKATCDVAIYRGVA